MSEAGGGPGWDEGGMSFPPGKPGPAPTHPQQPPEPRGFGDDAGDPVVRNKPSRAELPSNLGLAVVALYPQA